MKFRSLINKLYGLLILVALFSCQAKSDLEWPEITSQNKPWTRWWWMGNAVNKTDLTIALEAYSEAGLGGVEITPIYGVKGYEEEFIDYLSPGWMDMLMHTLKKAEELELGVDMATGTGWPFGGRHPATSTTADFSTSMS